MPDLWMDVDAALSEVPVNIFPLIDNTDFKSIEAAIAYNAAGMALYWHFVTTAGAYSVTAVTPTTGGNYDWTDQGDAGIYTIEIPASGGASINNDTEGFGWFTGVATGVLPWRSPTIGFRAAGLNNLLIDDAYSATRGLSGTALPAAAADAAGGLPISDAGGLDIDAKLANTNEVTAARMGALTDWINGGRLDLILDIIAADTTTDIPALIATLQTYVDTEVGTLVTEMAKVPKSDSNVTWNATALASINTEVDTALNTAIPGSPTANSVNERVATMDGLLLGTIAAGTHVAQSGDSYARLGSPTGASVSADIAAIEGQTDDIGAAGAGLTAVPWNAAWDAEVQSEVADALAVYDPPTNTEMEARTLVSAGYASPTNITAGTITTVTNLTNAPSAGDFTATMKTSLNAATPAVTVSDKTGFSLSTAGILAIWHQLTSAIVTASTIGKLIVDNLNDTISSRSTYAGTDTSGTTTLLSRIVGTLAAGTHNPQTGDAYARLGAPAGASVSADIADVPTVAEMNARTLAAADYATATNLGTVDAVVDAIKLKTDNLPTDPADESLLEAAIAAIPAAPTAAANADAVWDELLSGHSGAGSAGLALSTASSGGVDPSVLADAIWDEALSGHSTAGTSGKKLTDLVNTDISSLATAVAVETVDTVVDAVKVVTDKIGTAVELDGAVYRFTTNALEQAPTGGSAPTVVQIRQEMDSNSTQLAAIVADTSELQTNQGNWLTATGFSTHSAADIWTSGTRTLTSFGTLIADIWTNATRTLSAFAFTPTPSNAGDTTAIKAVTDKIDSTVELDGAVYRFTVNALEQAPAGGGSGTAPTVEQIDTQLSSTHGSGLWGAATGSGSISTTITINVSGQPRDGVTVWATTDVYGINRVASGVTDALGEVDFMLDAGTYYVWKQLSGVNFTNPETMEVS